MPKRKRQTKKRKKIKNLGKRKIAILSYAKAFFFTKIKISLRADFFILKLRKQPARKNGKNGEDGNRKNRVTKRFLTIFVEKEKLKKFLQKKQKKCLHHKEICGRMLP